MLRMGMLLAILLSFGCTVRGSEPVSEEQQAFQRYVQCVRLYTGEYGRVRRQALGGKSVHKACIEAVQLGQAEGAGGLTQDQDEEV